MEIQLLDTASWLQPWAADCTKGTSGINAGRERNLSVDSRAPIAQQSATQLDRAWWSYLFDTEDSEIMLLRPALQPLLPQHSFSRYSTAVLQP